MITMNESFYVLYYQVGLYEKHICFSRTERGLLNIMKHRETFYPIRCWRAKTCGVPDGILEAWKKNAYQKSLIDFTQKIDGLLAQYYHSTGRHEPYTKSCLVCNGARCKECNFKGYLIDPFLIEHLHLKQYIEPSFPEPVDTMPDRECFMVLNFASGLEVKKFSDESSFLKRLSYLKKPEMVFYGEEITIPPSVMALYDLRVEAAQTEKELKKVRELEYQAKRERELILSLDKIFVENE